MRASTMGLAAAWLLCALSPAAAVVRPDRGEPAVVSADPRARSQRATAFVSGGRLAGAGLAGWTAIWDRDTDVPLRLWGGDLAAPGALADPAIAEAAARRFLAAHLRTLAPGAAPGDFTLVANQLSGSGDVRSVGFVQRAGGLRVVGGAIGFSFKRDRLIMVSSTALPHVVVAPPGARLAAPAIAAAATGWLARAGHRAAVAPAALAAPGERVIVPVVRPRSGRAPDIAYRVAESIAVADPAGPDRWTVWIDAADATPIARESKLMYATGRVLFDVPDRGPHSTRQPQPASFANHLIDGAPATAALDGTVSWAGTAPGSVALKLTGTFVTVVNDDGSPPVAETLTLAPGGTLVWSKAGVAAADAQLDAYVYANQAKQFARARINPNLAYLDRQLRVVVNDPRSCNAFSTGDDIHFFSRGACENTARLADVVYHEFGHSLHTQSIIPGVGAFDGALSEGLADTLAVLITGDPGMGRGFQFTNDALRDLAPAVPKRWPDNVIGEVHADGEIIGQALWDLRQALEAKLGKDAGLTRTIEIFYGIMQRANDIPSSFAEALVSDDDDGALANGTPNQCELVAAFGRHGLADPEITIGLAPPVRDGLTISIAADPAAALACPGLPVISSAIVDWKPRGAGVFGRVTLAADGAGFRGELPDQPEGTVLQYKVTVALSDGGTVVYPQNRADPFYEMYVGPVTPLWCADFEAGAADWSHGGAGDEWQAGAPRGLGGDPDVAHGGSQVFGFDLSDDGVYAPGLSRVFAAPPAIDVRGAAAVRLQYYRWLGVEDAFYDRASIQANGAELWTNFRSPTEPQAREINHVDREWRFHDVDLTSQLASGMLQLRFELSSDQGLELGGWTLDDVCVVAVTGIAVTCGDASVDDGETCDDGNRLDGDGCSANCVDESTGGGCCSSSASPGGALVLGLATLGVAGVIGRRRRRR